MKEITIKINKEDFKRKLNIKDGEPGYTPKKGIDYNDGEPGKTPVKGIDYNDGKDGYTPKKGIDYKDGEDYVLTEEDKKEIARSIDVPVVERVIVEKHTEVVKEIETRATLIAELLNPHLEYSKIKNAPEFKGLGGTGYLREITDVAITNPTQGQVLKYNAVTNKWENGTDTGGVSRFIDLTDAPSSYSGQTGKAVRVKSDETGLEFYTPVTSVSWGSITGTLSAQTDLQTALDAKVPTSRTLTINGTSYDLSANRTWSVGTVTGATDSTLTLTGTTLGINLSNPNTWLADQSVPDEVYGAGWNGSMEIPTKNALYDIINTLPSGSGTALQVAYWSGTNTVTGDTGFIYDPVLNQVGIQVADPLAPLHVAAVTGATINDVVSGSATLVTETLPTAPTGTITKIGEPAAGTGGSIAFIDPGSGTAIASANGAVYTFRVYPVLVATDFQGTVYYRSQYYEEIGPTMDPNDSQSYNIELTMGSVTITGETVEYYVEVDVNSGGFIPFNRTNSNPTVYTSLASGSNDTTAWPTYYNNTPTTPPGIPSGLSQSVINEGSGTFSGASDGTTWYYEVDSYENIGGTIYVSGTPTTSSLMDNNNGQSYDWQLSYTPGSPSGGSIVRRSNDNATWSYQFIDASGSYIDYGFSDDPAAAARWGQTYSAGSVNYDYAPYGKGDSPSFNAIYGTAGTTYSTTLSADSINYIFKHTFSGTIPVGGGKILAPQASPSYGLNVSSDFYDGGYTSWGSGTTVIPNSYGYTGTNQNRDYKVTGTNGSIYSVTPLIVSTVAGSGSKYVSLSWTLPSGVSAVKILRQVNGTGYTYGKNVTGSSTTDDSTDTGWVFGNTTVTPTSEIPVAGRFDRATSSVTAVPQVGAVAIDSSTVAIIGFGAANSSSSEANWFSRFYANTSDGYIHAASARLYIENSPGGSITTIMGAGGYIFNNNNQNNQPFQIKGNVDNFLMFANMGYDTIGFGQQMLSDPQSTIKIQPARSTDLALLLAGHASMSATSELLRFDNSAGSIGGSITVGGHFLAGDGSASNVGIGFRGQSGVGMYRVASNSMALVLGGVEKTRWTTTGVYFGTSAGVNPSARIHIQAGTTAANTAPIMLTSGSLMTAPQIGAIEFLTDRMYYTRTTSSTRLNFLASTAVPTATRVWYSDSNGFQQDTANFTYVSNRLSPTYITLAAQTTSAGTGPLKFTSSASVMATPESGVFEYSNPDILFTPASAIRYNLPLVTGAGVQGDLIYASGASIYSRLAKNTSATRYLSNTGSSNNPAWAQIDLTNGVTGILPQANGGTGVSKTILFDHFANSGNVGTGEDDLYSDTLTAGQFSANGQKIICQYGGTFVGDATSTQRVRMYFGGTLIFDTGALGIGVTTSNWDIYATIIRVSSSVVRCSVTLNTSFATLNAYAQYTEVTGLTLANTQVVKITGEAAGVSAATDQIIAREGYAQFLPAA